MDGTIVKASGYPFSNDPMKMDLRITREKNESAYWEMAILDSDPPKWKYFKKAVSRASYANEVLIPHISYLDGNTDHRAWEIPYEMFNKSWEDFIYPGEGKKE